MIRVSAQTTTNQVSRMTTSCARYRKTARTGSRIKTPAISATITRIPRRKTRRSTGEKGDIGIPKIGRSTFRRTRDSGDSSTLESEVWECSKKSPGKNICTCFFYPSSNFREKNVYDSYFRLIKKNESLSKS